MALFEIISNFPSKWEVPQRSKTFCQRESKCTENNNWRTRRMHHGQTELQQQQHTIYIENRFTTQQQHCTRVSVESLGPTTSSESKSACTLERCSIRGYECAESSTASRDLVRKKGLLLVMAFSTTFR